MIRRTAVVAGVLFFGGGIGTLTYIHFNALDEAKTAAAAGELRAKTAAIAAARAHDRAARLQGLAHDNRADLREALRLIRQQNKLLVRLGADPLKLSGSGSGGSRPQDPDPPRDRDPPKREKPPPKQEPPREEPPPGCGLPVCVPDLPEVRA